MARCTAVMAVLFCVGAGCDASSSSGIENGSADGGGHPDGAIVMNDAGMVVCAADRCSSIDPVPRTADDHDLDGIADDFDTCPFAYDPGQADGDADGIGDVCDNCPMRSSTDATDTDNDGFGDVCDEDDDNDGVVDPQDVCPQVADPGQADTDGDSIGNACDGDDDDDGVRDAVDNCPLVGNPDQQPNGTPAECFSDADGDQVADSRDNCFALLNFDQADRDGDGRGDACDDDLDSDDVPNNVDNCPTVSNGDQLDGDRDGRGDACDERFCSVVRSFDQMVEGAPFDPAHCLDPDLSFTVLTDPFIEASIGQPIRLRVLANREDLELDYSWSVLEAPMNSQATPSFATGTVSSSEDFEYRVDPAPVLIPDASGTYRLRLQAELRGPDPMLAGGSTVATTEVTVTVANDCSCP